MINYQIGTYVEDEYGDRVFKALLSQRFDSDAQAELAAKQYIEDHQPTDMYGDPLFRLRIRRGNVEWSGGDR